MPAPCAIIIAERFTIQRVVIIGAFIGLIGIALSSLMVNMLYFTIVFGVSYGEFIAHRISTLPDLILCDYLSPLPGILSKSYFPCVSKMLKIQ